MIGDFELLKELGKRLESRGEGIGLTRDGQEGGLVEPAQLRDLLIENLLKIRAKGKRLSYLQLNRAQREYSRQCGRRNIVLKARQLGLTTYVAARFFVQTITQPGTVTMQIAHNQESAEEIFKIVHRFWENLPIALQRGVLQRSRANVRQMVFPLLDSEYRVAAADENAGRGLTIHNLHCSEVARWPRDGEETLASLRAAVTTGGEVVLESTPNGASGVFYEEWMRADENGYTKHFFPWWMDEDYVLEQPKGLELFPLTPEEEILTKRHGLSQPQLAWRRVMWSQLRNLGPQEYAEDPVSCFRASGECVFDLEAIDRMMAGSGEPLEMADNRRLMTWWPPQKERSYVIGVDPAGGGADGDYSCAQVIERKTGMQCAELHGHFPPQELANRLVELGDRYNRALIGVERNNHGHGVLAHLKDLKYENLFCQGGQEGWLTSVASRPAMIEHLAGALVTSPLLFRSTRFLGELRTFVRRADGNAAAATGAHDDCVMAMAIAWAVRREVAGQRSRRGLEVLSLPAQ